MSEVEEVIKLVEEAKAPGVFNILDVVKDRAYPKESIAIYIDESAAYLASNLKEKIGETQQLVDGLVDVEANTKLLSELNQKLDAVLEKLELSKYIFDITGISEGVRDEAFTKAREAFEIKYEEIKNPFTGEVTKTEIENLERDRYLTNLLWSLSIVKIVAPDGSEQTSINDKDVDVLRKSLPASANILINGSIEKLRAASATFLLSVGEDFLAKS
jgi:hypothetical protein